MFLLIFLFLFYFIMQNRKLDFLLGPIDPVRTQPIRINANKCSLQSDLTRARDLKIKKENNYLCESWFTNKSH